MPISFIYCYNDRGEQLWQTPNSPQTLIAVLFGLLQKNLLTPFLCFVFFCFYFWPGSSLQGLISSTRGWTWALSSESTMSTPLSHQGNPSDCFAVACHFGVSFNPSAYIREESWLLFKENVSVAGVPSISCASPWVQCFKTPCQETSSILPSSYCRSNLICFEFPVLILFLKILIIWITKVIHIFCNIWNNKEVSEI